MMARSIALCILLAGSSAALGGVEVVLSPTTTGPYSPGEIVAVDVMLSQAPTGDPQLLRLVQLDFTASDAGLSIALPTSHAAASVAFWDFSTVPDCIADDADCGAGHFIDDELPGLFPPGPDVISITYVGDLADPGNPDLNENFNRQWLLAGDGTAKKIGQLRITLPAGTLPGSCPLDVLNAAETDVAFGARVDFGFGETGRTTWRASAGEITGDALDLCATTQVDANLLADQSEPPCDATLSHTNSNVVRLTFSEAVTLPTGVEIWALDAAGTLVGVDLADNFLYSLESGDTVLRIEEDGTVFSDETWYLITNTGGWGGVSNFDVTYVVMPGNANGDNFTDFGDLSVIFGNQVGGPDDQNPYNINSDGFVDFGDLSAAFGFNGSSKPTRPPGHACTAP